MSNSHLTTWLARLGLAFAATACAQQEEPKAAPQAKPAASAGKAFASAREEALALNQADLIPKSKAAYITHDNNGLLGWSNFLDALTDNDLMLGVTTRFVFLRIFAAEGGFRMAPGGSAVGGIMNDTLKRLLNDDSKDPFVQKLRKDLTEQLKDYAPNERTSGLSPAEIPRLYIYDLLDRFSDLPQVRGTGAAKDRIEEVLAGFGEPHVALAAIDALFRFGDKGGARILTAAVNKFPAGTPVDKDKTFRLTDPLYNALKAHAKNPQPLLDKIAKKRGVAVEAQSRRKPFRNHAKSLKAGEGDRSREFSRRDPGVVGAGPGVNGPS